MLAIALAASVPSGTVTPYAASFFASRQPTTALDMVGLLPGFVLDVGDHVRGFGGAAGNVLIDGVRPATKDDSLDEILKRIPASAVLRIDIIRGGAPGINMQGKTVIANIIRRRGNGGRLTISAAEITDQAGREGFGLRVEGARTLGPTTWEGSLLAQHGYDDSTGSGTRLEISPGGGAVTGGPETSIGSSYVWKATGGVDTQVWGGKLKANIALQVTPQQYIQNDLLGSPAALNQEHDLDGQDTAELGVRYDRPFGDKVGLETYLLQQFGQVRNRSNLNDPGDVELLRLAKNTSESIGRATVTIRAAPTLTIQSGVEGDFNWLLDHTLYFINDAPQVVPAANVRVTEYRGELFGTSTWQAARTLTVETGIRLEASRIASTGDDFDVRSYLFPKPRVAVSWSPDAADQLRFRVEREVSQLDFDDFAASAAPLSNGAVRAGNPELDPQRDWVFEAAYDRRFWSAGQITLTLRHYDYGYVIDRIPIYSSAGPYDAPGNIGSGEKDEAAVTLTLPTDRLGVKNGSLTAQSTFRRSRVIDPTTGQPRSISGLHPLDAEVHFTQGLPRWKALWGIDYYDQYQETYYRFDEIDSSKTKSYVSAFAEYKPRPDLSFRVEFQNLGGRGVRETRQIYLGPRNGFPLDYTDIRDTGGRRAIYFRVRKTFE